MTPAAVGQDKPPRLDIIPLMAKLSIRIDLDPGGRVGPGKITLLERVQATGSISAAGRELKMSYRRAWQLVAEMNAIFGRPLVDAKTGGKNGGGAALTPFGRDVVEHYRSIELSAEKAVRNRLRALQAASARK